MKPLSSERKREIFNEFAYDHSAWRRKADDLLHTASFLEKEVGLIYGRLGPQFDSAESWDYSLHRNNTADVYFMLVGYAIENILKGILVRLPRGGGNNSIPAAELPKELLKHDVLSLAKKAGFDLDSFEEDLLGRMAEIIVWRARYQTPKSFESIKEFYRRDNDLKVLQKFLAKITRK